MSPSRWPRSPSHGKCSKRFCSSSRSYGRSHRPRQHEAFDCHAFKRNRQEECVQMPVKIARSAPRASFGLPELLIASTPRVSLATRPERREYSRQFGCHPGNPGSIVLRNLPFAKRTSSEWGYQAIMRWWRVRPGSKLIRAVLRIIPFIRRYERLVTKLEEHNRLLTVAATESARKLQDREAELTQALTERARKLQDREAELTQALTERARKAQEREAELTQALTERARKAQEREAELTQALTVISQRVMKLSEHDRWLTENVMDAVSELQECDAEITVQSGVLGQLIMQKLPQDREQQVLFPINAAERRVREPSHQS